MTKVTQIANNSMSSDSSDDEEPVNDVFRSICDPQFSFKATEKYVHNEHKNKHFIDDEAINETVNQILRNINSANKHSVGTLSGCVPSSVRHKRPASSLYCGSSDSTPAVPYLTKKFIEILSSQVIEYPSPAPDSPTADSEEQPPVECEVQLLPGLRLDLTQCNSGSQLQQQREWLQQIRKRKHSQADDDKKTIEERCKAVAVSGEFILQGGMRSQYAEYKNTLERKVERVQLLKEKNNILYIQPRNELKQKCKVKATKVAKPASKSLTGNKDETPEEVSVPKKNKKARKRGPKKKKCKTILE